MPPNQMLDFFQGLLGGLSGGIVEQATQQRKQQFLQDMEQSRIAGELLKSGNYEAFSLIDPKIQKSLGFQQGDPRIQGLVKFQQTARDIEKRKAEAGIGAFESETAARQATARTANIAAQEKEQQQRTIANLPNDKQIAAILPHLADHEARMEQYKQESANRQAVLAERQREFDLKQQELTAHHEEQMAQLRESRASREQIAAEQQAFNRDKLASEKELKQEMQQQKKLDSALRERQNAIAEHDKVMKNAPRQTKVGNNTVPQFDNEQAAKTWISEANRAQRRIDLANKEIAAIDGREPEKPLVWRYESNKTGMLSGIGLGTNVHLAIPEVVGGVSEAQQPSVEPRKSFLDQEIENAQPKAGATPAPTQSQSTTPLNPSQRTQQQKQQLSQSRRQQAQTMERSTPRGRAAAQTSQPAQYRPEFTRNFPDADIGYLPTYIELRREMSEEEAADILKAAIRNDKATSGRK